MHIGITFPQTEIGADPAAVVAYAQAAEDLGCSHILAFDHVLLPDASVRPGYKGFYKIPNQFLEPFVLFGFLAGVTKRIHFASGVLILPQRQTALVAKQAAVVDVLSKGRLRLGIGTGWNDTEYLALKENFHNRGKRSEEQIAVMRALWTNQVVTFKGKWHEFESMGMNPLPVQRPIPVWLGGNVPEVRDRIGRIGDGWILTRFIDADKVLEAFEDVRRAARGAGRDPALIGFEGRVNLADTTPDQQARQVEDWQRVGASHVSLNTMDAGLTSPQAHIDAVRRFMEAVKGIAKPSAAAPQGKTAGA